MTHRFVALAVGCLALAPFLPVRADESPEALQIGSRRELFVDDFLIDKTKGTAELVLQKPEPQDVVLVTDKPWEGNTCAYYTIFQDDDLYRMYYRGSHFDEEKRKKAHPEYACYAESRDGIDWTKPELGLFEFDGSKQTNIVWSGVGTHNFTPFRDPNPQASPDAKYKALGRGRGGLYAFQSADAIHWSLMSDKPVISKGAFDSQNLAFWDPLAKIYRDYHRDFRGVRDIRTCTSTDFLNWTDPEFLEYPGAPKEHLYTNAILQYHRAPHIFLGFPTRYQPKRNSQVEPTLMTSRDGRTFHRWLEPVIPVTAPKDRDTNRSNYMAWGLVELPDAPKELSVYGTEAYYTGPDSRLRRFTYRVDGFVALHADADGGELITKPLVFDGQSLELNYVTAEKGSVQVEVQDANGRPIPGFTLADCPPIRGDAIASLISWNDRAELGKLAGKPVRLRFVLKDADVFSFRFRTK